MQQSWKKSDLTGEVEWAHIIRRPPPFVNPTRPVRSRRKRQGLLYQQKLDTYLTAAYPHQYIPGPWVRYSVWEDVRWCQPDGLIIDIVKGRITIVEAKYSHVIDAWYQLIYLYLPVVKAIFGESTGLWRYSTLEIVKWFDPAVQCPQQPTMCHTPHLAKPGDFSVNIWRP